MSRGSSRASDLWFGVRLAFRGARLRTALTALGLGMAAAVLFFAAALPNAIEAEGQRVDARAYYGAEQTPARSDTTALVAGSPSTWRGSQVGGLLIQADGTQPPVPPGLHRAPAEGERFVSPALADRLDDPDAALLRERLGGRVVGTIGREGLSGPRELLWYGGTNELAGRERSARGVATRIDGFRAPPEYPSSIEDSSFYSLIVLMGSLALLFPIAILVATAARFGSARRDRRLSALRLLGSTQERTAWIAAGESLAGALLGLGVGATLFVAGLAVIERVSVFGFSLFASDLAPNPWLVTAIALGVLITTVGASLFALRRVAIEPLSVSRRGGAAQRRQLWWRLVPFGLGFAVLARYLFGPPVNVWDHLPRITFGALLMLWSIAALLPWAIEMGVRMLRPWSVSSRLAIRSLQHDASGGARVVGGIAVAIAGAVTLQTLLTIDQERFEPAAGAPVPISATVSASASGDLAVLSEIRKAARSTPGVERVAVTGQAPIRIPGRRPWSSASLTVGTCADLAQVAAIGPCDDATSMYRATQRTPAPGTDADIFVPSGGDTIEVDRLSRGGWATIQLPADLPTVPATASATGTANTGILATEAAFAASTPGAQPWSIDAAAWLDPNDPLARERFTNAILRIDPLAGVYDAGEYTGANTLPTLRRALLAGAALLLLLIGSSLLVTTLEQLTEQRRTLATLAATGTPRAVLRRSLWWRMAIPTVIGIALGVMVGMTLGATLLEMQNEPVRFDPESMANVSALAAGLVAGVTLLALPLLRRVSAPLGMRTE